MTMNFNEIKNAEETLLCRTYSRYPVALVKGCGSRLWDVNGKEYIDLLAGIAVTALGHCNPEVNKALLNQADILWHVSNLFYQEPQLDLARLLLSTTYHSKAFFCNSGAEANEACIKLVRRYMRKIKKRDAFEIISLTDAFHGRTLGTLAATGRHALSDGFEPLPGGFIQIEAGNIQELQRAINPKTAAVLLECVQGEAGVEPLPESYLQEVDKLCKSNDILLICDEVQCGLGRTGTFWAFQQSGIKPDAISCAKALANGLPMGAMLATDELAKGFEAGSHATTFGGGALTSAAACKTIEILLRDNLAGRAAELGKKFIKRLNDLQSRFPDYITQIRGKGLMIGIELGTHAPEIWKLLLDRGIICNLSHNRTLRLLPALTIPWDDLEKFIEIFASLLEEKEKTQNKI